MNDKTSQGHQTSECRFKWTAPDWYDEEAYPENPSGVRWAWEFLRRNPLYQADWQHELCLYAKHHQLQGQKADPDYLDYLNLGELDDIRGSKGRRYYVETYGLYELLNPNVSAQDKITIEPSFGSVFVQSRDGFRPVRVGLHSGQALGLFDLNLPIDQQVKAVTKALKKSQKEHRTGRGDGQAVKISRVHRRLLRTYLRLLDAEHQKATVEEMADGLFPTQKNRKSPYNDKRRVIDGLKAAKRYRDSGYRHLAYGWVVTV